MRGCWTYQSEDSHRLPAVVNKAEEFITIFWRTVLRGIVVINLLKTKRNLFHTGLFISPSGISDPLRYSSRDGHAEGGMSTEEETLQVSVLHLQFPARAICWLLRASDKPFSHTLDSLGRWPRPASSFRSAQASTLLEFHVPLTNCFVRRWFCAVHGPKPPLHRHNWLSFGKFQDTERFLKTVHAIFRHDYPLAVEPASTPRPLVQKKLREILYQLICSFLPCLSWLLQSRVRKFRRDLWITCRDHWKLYLVGHI